MQNRVVGTWKMVSAYANPKKDNIAILGSNPNGLLIFTKDFYFSVVVNNPDTPLFVSGDRFNGTADENKLAVINSLGLFGTYTVDSNGDFFDQQILGSTFPNWNGVQRGRKEITETVEGDNMIEHLKVSEDLLVEIVWQRIKIDA